MQVLCKEEDFVISAHQGGQSSETLEEAVGRGAGQVKLQRFENLELHLEDLLLREFVFRDRQEVFELRWVNFFIFGRDKQSSDSEDVQLVLFDLLER